MAVLALHAFPPLIIAVIVGNALLAGWAFLVDLRRGRLLGPSFWGTLLIVLALIVVQVAAGIVLAAGGARPKTWLHVLYGILVSGTAGVQYGLRPRGFLRPRIALDSARFREPRLLALVCLTQAALILRAYTTGAFGR